MGLEWGAEGGQGASLLDLVCVCQIASFLSALMHSNIENRTTATTGALQHLRRLHKTQHALDATMQRCSRPKDRP